MPIDYDTLTGTKETEGSIRNWVNDSTIPATTILIEAEAWIWLRLRIRTMVQTAILTFATDASTGTLPDDFFDPIEFRPYGASCELPYVHEQKLEAHRDEDGNLFSGTPSRWTIIGVTPHVDVKCTETLAGILMYYGLPDALSSDNPTNALTRSFPTLLRTVCLAFAYDFKKDDARKTAALAYAEKQLEDANKAIELHRRGQAVPY